MSEKSARRANFSNEQGANPDSRKARDRSRKILPAKSRRRDAEVVSGLRDERDASREEPCRTFATATENRCTAGVYAMRECELGKDWNKALQEKAPRVW